MDRTRSFRHHLLRRFFTLLGLSIPAAGVAIAACGVHVAVDGTSANRGGGGCIGMENGQCMLQPAPEGAEVQGLGDVERASLAEAWASEGLRKHAKVASFGRFALELLATGAPASLVADAHRAALDEVRHARTCFALASSYAGEALVPAPFDFGRGAPVQVDVVALAERTFAEGCVGGTLAAVRAEEQLGAATDPAVREALRAIADDEARHAELAWRTLGWCLESGGERVGAAILGGVDRLEIQGGGERALTDVVLPCARALLRSKGSLVARASAVDLAIEASAA